MVSLYSCSQIHSPLLGNKVDYGIRLSYLLASQCSLTAMGWLVQPYAVVKFIPQSGTMNWASGRSEFMGKNFLQVFSMIRIFDGIQTEIN